MAFDTALSTAHTLSGNTPQQPLTLVAVSWCSGRPHLKVMGSSAGNGVDQSLERLLIDMTLLHEQM